MAKADTGEIVNLNSTIYTVVNENYLQNTPLSVDTYNGIGQSSTVCNKELLIEFNWPGEISDDYINPIYPDLIWGYKPYVVNDRTYILEFSFTGPVLILKLSKKVTEFGMEYNTPYYDRDDVTQSIWDKKTKTKIAEGRTIPLNTKLPDVFAWFGGPGGAILMAMKSKIPFDEVRITISDPTGAPITRRNMVHIISGIRYTLAE
jgi:hypothetical protein